VFDPSVVTYNDLLKVFWRGHSPLYAHSRQYMSAIHFHSEEQRRMAEESVADAIRLHHGKPATVIVPATDFWVAEDYHQKYRLRSRPLGRMLSDAEIRETAFATKANGEA
jgi:peptide-methionine (S)-S-oxide reductase